LMAAGCRRMWGKWAAFKPGTARSKPAKQAGPEGPLDSPNRENRYWTGVMPLGISDWMIVRSSSGGGGTSIL
jgi:hypothetical protein